MIISIQFVFGTSWENCVILFYIRFSVICSQVVAVEQIEDELQIMTKHEFEKFEKKLEEQSKTDKEKS